MKTTVSVLLAAAIAGSLTGSSLKVASTLGGAVAETAQSDLVSRRGYTSQSRQYQGGTGRREILSHRIEITSIA